MYIRINLKPSWKGFYSKNEAQLYTRALVLRDEETLERLCRCQYKHGLLIKACPVCMVKNLQRYYAETESPTAADEIDPESPLYEDPDDYEIETKVGGLYE